MSDERTLLNTFSEIASHPRRQMDQYLARGLKIVGCQAPYAPEEIVHAMGMVPMGLWGADMALSEAKRYFPTFICSIMQSMVELGIRGAYDGMSCILMPSLCDAMQATVENWKYAVPSIPIVYADYPQNRFGKAGHDYLRATHERQIARLTELTGATCTDEALSQSIEIYKEHAETMKAFSELAGKCGMKPSDRSAVFKSAWFMLKQEHTALVRELMAVMKPCGEKKIGVMTTGILADQPGLLRIMDGLNMTILCDDVAHESRQSFFCYPKAETPLDTLADKFCTMKHCSLIYDPQKTRIGLILEEARAHGAKGIIFIQTKFCDPEEFDYVFLKRACESAGIPLIMIEADRQMTNYDQAGTALQTFCEMIQ